MRVVIEQSDLNASPGIENAYLQPWQPWVRIASSIAPIRFDIENARAYSNIATGKAKQAKLEGPVNPAYVNHANLREIVVPDAVLYRNRRHRRLLTQIQHPRSNAIYIGIPLDKLKWPTRIYP